MWKRKKAATCREMGKEYMSYKGTLASEKKVNLGVLCSEKCPLKCTEKITIEERTRLFQYCYSLDLNSLQKYLHCKCQTL